MSELETDQETEIEAVDLIESQDDVIEESQTTDTTDEVIGLDVPDGLEEGLTEWLTGIEDIKGRNANIEKFKNFNDGYLKKINGVADDRKAFETEKAEHQTANQFYDGYKAFESSMQPEVKAHIVGQFGGVPQYSKWLHEQDVLINKDPVNYALQLLKGSGFTKDNIGEAYGDSYNQYNQNREMGQQQEQQTQNIQKMFEDYKQEQEGIKTQESVDSFVNATTETGEPKHPHFKEVENTMVALQQVHPEASYESLYDMACKTHPTIAPTYMQGQVQSEAKKIVNKQDVNKARKVTGVKSSVDSVGTTANQGWQEHLEDQIEAG